MKSYIPKADITDRNRKLLSPILEEISKLKNPTESDLMTQKVLAVMAVKHQIIYFKHHLKDNINLE